MRHVPALFDHALRATGELLSWHPGPTAQFLSQVVRDLAGSEAPRLWVSTAARLHWTRLTALADRIRNR
ncbi:hypothetical protein ACFVGY_13260 [Streptomyces sp. NPDC127106]|uniref:hypothetical protein n=1 Tax=Streptomyces sp. NPDC127106 TaxID=3345360 RepID=UPI00363C161C